MTNNYKSIIIARYDSIFQYEYNYLIKDSIINDLQTVKRENAIEYIEEIEPDSAWQEELQFTLLEFLHLAKNDTLLSSEMVYDLANSCPDKYGHPVYHARSLIRQDSIQIYYDDDALCNYLNPRATEDITIQAGRLFPNPASTEIHIVAEADILKIQVFTISGKEVYLNSQISDKSAVIDVSILPPGLYHLRTFSEDKEVEFYKFIISGR